MIFSSPIFLFFFLPVVLLIFYLAPKRGRNLVLFLSSIFFYSWGEKALVLVMLFSSVADYFFALFIEKGNRKMGLWLSVITNLSVLGFFKYFNFTFDNFNNLLEWFGYNWEGFYRLPHIALPIGISFYTFQTMSYTIDVYRGNVKANRNFIDFATYVTMFPQLVAGPIVRYVDVELQLANKLFTIDRFSHGVERFIVGLAKKMILANGFAAIADSIFSQNYEHLSVMYAWIGIITYSMQIYYDFSAYSDMAIGLGKMFGFDFLDNFNYPYIAKSIRDFWRRWHISLSNWFRDYLYISLGGNRKGKIRMYIALLVVFFCTGLWHGASWNFVLWGLFHGFFIMGERLIGKKWIGKIPTIFKHLYLILVVIIGWVLFRTETFLDAVAYWKAMFGFGNPNEAIISYLEFFNLNLKTFVFIIVGAIFCAPVYVKIERLFYGRIYGLLRPAFFVILFALSLIYVGSGSYNPFIYFRF